MTGRGRDRAEFDALSARARSRAHEAAERAAAARERALELAQLGRDAPMDPLAAEENAEAQSARARRALMHSAEGHERTARVHDDAAELEEARGHPEKAAQHRAAAERSRRLAQADRVEPS